MNVACFVQSCLTDADFVIFSNYCLIGTRPSAPGASLLSALGLGNLFSGAEGLVSRLLPDGVDAGDILLLLIVLYLLAEGDDLDLVIALGLTLVLGLGSGKERGKDSTQGGTVAAP